MMRSTNLCVSILYNEKGKSIHMSKLYENISIEIKGNGDGTYDTYIATESCSGEHYEAITAETIGEYVADLIDTLEDGMDRDEDE